MNFEIRKSCVFRSYVALARGERLTPSDIATWDVYDERAGELLESIARAQIDHDEERELIALLSDKRDVTPERFTELMIFRRPTELQNLIYSARLRRSYPQIVSMMPEFVQGVLQLPNGHGVMLPIKIGRLITRLAFVPFSKLAARRG